MVGTPRLSPTIPREITNALENGSKLSTANTRSATRTSATCRSRTNAHTAASGTTSSSAHTSIHMALLLPGGGAVLLALADHDDARIGRGAVHERAEALQLLRILERGLPLAPVAAHHPRHLRL